MWREGGEERRQGSHAEVASVEPEAKPAGPTTDATRVPRARSWWAGRRPPAREQDLQGVPRTSQDLTLTPPSPQKQQKQSKGGGPGASEGAAHGAAELRHCHRLGGGPVVGPLVGRVLRGPRFGCPGFGFGASCQMREVERGLACWFTNALWVHRKWQGMKGCDNSGFECGAGDARGQQAAAGLTASPSVLSPPTHPPTRPCVHDALFT